MTDSAADAACGTEPTALAERSGAPPPSLTPALDDAPVHSLPRRLLGRFALLAFGLYHVPLFINAYPTLGGGGFRDHGLSHTWGHIFGHVGLWVARNVLGRTGPMPYALEGDNGDTAEEVGRLLAGVVLAALVAVVWTIADRRHPRARWVEAALHVLLRYAILLGLASYAMAKLYPIQFRSISPITLEQHVGELTPFGLLWSFMQYSRAYSTFAGVMEMLVVMLLAFRRTATIGALLCIPVLSNVALMNLCYGVPVKVFSISMVVSAAVLVLYDARRLAGALLGTPAAPPAPSPRPSRSRRLEALRWSLKLVVVGGVIVSSALPMSESHAQRSAGEASPLYGTWEVQSMVDDGTELAKTGEPSRWRRMIVTPRGVAIRLESDVLLRCERTSDQVSQTLAFTCSSTHQDGSLHWSRTNTALQLEGTFDHRPLRASLTLRDDSALPLLKERFEWIMD
jgi:hypothetical protein